MMIHASYLLGADTGVDTAWDPTRLADATTGAVGAAVARDPSHDAGPSAPCDFNSNDNSDPREVGTWDDGTAAGGCWEQLLPYCGLPALPIGAMEAPSAGPPAVEPPNYPADPYARGVGGSNVVPTRSPHPSAPYFLQPVAPPSTASGPWTARLTAAMTSDPDPHRAQPARWQGGEEFRSFFVGPDEDEPISGLADQDVKGLEDDLRLLLSEHGFADADIAGQRTLQDIAPAGVPPPIVAPASGENKRKGRPRRDACAIDDRGKRCRKRAREQERMRSREAELESVLEIADSTRSQRRARARNRTAAKWAAAGMRWPPPRASACGSEGGGGDGVAAGTGAEAEIDAVAEVEIGTDTGTGIEMGIGAADGSAPAASAPTAARRLDDADVHATVPIPLPVPVSVFASAAAVPTSERPRTPVPAHESTRGRGRGRGRGYGDSQRRTSRARPHRHGSPGRADPPTVRRLRRRVRELEAQLRVVPGEMPQRAYEAPAVPLDPDSEQMELLIGRRRGLGSGASGALPPPLRKRPPSPHRVRRSMRGGPEGETRTEGRAGDERGNDARTSADERNADDSDNDDDGDSGGGCGGDQGSRSSGVAASLLRDAIASRGDAGDLPDLATLIPPADPPLLPYVKPDAGAPPSCDGRTADDNSRTTEGAPDRPARGSEKAAGALMRPPRRKYRYCNPLIHDEGPAYNPVRFRVPIDLRRNAPLPEDREYCANAHHSDPEFLDFTLFQPTHGVRQLAYDASCRNNRFRLPRSSLTAIQWRFPAYAVVDGIEYRVVAPTPPSEYRVRLPYEYTLYEPEDVDVTLHTRMFLIEDAGPDEGRGDDGEGGDDGDGKPGEEMVEEAEEEEKQEEAEEAEEMEEAGETGGKREAIANETEGTAWREEGPDERGQADANDRFGGMAGPRTRSRSRTRPRPRRRRGGGARRKRRQGGDPARVHMKVSRVSSVEAIRGLLRDAGLGSHVGPGAAGERGDVDALTDARDLHEGQTLHVLVDRGRVLETRRLLERAAYLVRDRLYRRRGLAVFWQEPAELERLARGHVERMRSAHRRTRSRARGIVSAAWPADSPDDAAERAADRTDAAGRERAAAWTSSEASEPPTADEEREMVLAVSMPLRTYVIRHLCACGSSVYTPDYLQTHKDELYDRGPPLTAEQTVQLLDAYYWTKLAPPETRVDYSDVLAFYEAAGRVARLKRPHEKHGESVGRTSESGRLRRFSALSAQQHGMLRSRHVIESPEGKAQARKPVGARPKKQQPPQQPRQQHKQERLQKGARKTDTAPPPPRTSPIAPDSVIPEPAVASLAAPSCERIPEPSASSSSSPPSSPSTRGSSRNPSPSAGLGVGDGSGRAQEAAAPARLYADALADEDAKTNASIRRRNAGGDGTESVSASAENRPGLPDFATKIERSPPPDGVTAAITGINRFLTCRRPLERSAPPSRPRRGRPRGSWSSAPSRSPSIPSHSLSPLPEPRPGARRGHENAIALYGPASGGPMARSDPPAPGGGDPSLAFRDERRQPLVPTMSRGGGLGTALVRMRRALSSPSSSSSPYPRASPDKGGRSPSRAVPTFDDSSSSCSRFADPSPGVAQEYDPASFCP